MKFAVFASGNGSNLQAIINAAQKKKIKADLNLVISDRAGAFALVRARKAKIPAVYVNPKDFPDREAFDRAVVGYLKEAKIDFIALAGFMRILSPYFIREYRHKILNVHPSLLPAFKGVQGIKDAFEYGVKVTGVTVHFVDDELDHGAIIAQEPLKVTAGDTLLTLTAKIHRLEHKIYPKIIDAFARGRLKIKGRRVI